MAALTNGVYSTGDAAVWIREVWEPEIGIAAYEEMRIGNNFKRIQAPEGKVHYRKHANLQRYSFGGPGTDQGVGATLNSSGNVEVEVTGLPQTSYIYVRTNLNTIARMIQDPTDIFRQSVEMSLAEGVDVACGAKITDLTQIVGSAADNITEALLQDAIVKAAKSMKSQFTP